MKLLTRFRPVRVCLEFWRRHWLGPQRRRMIFEHIYKANLWRNANTRSGHGSTLAQTETVRAVLPGLIEEFGIRSIVDVPCGDFFWMQQVDLKGARYTGIDIVAGLIAENAREYGNDQRQFLCLDVVENVLPEADLIFCRDMLVHFSFAYLKKAIHNIRLSGSRYLLTTSFPETAENTNIMTGEWRRLNLEKPPFNFPPPIRMINENCTEDGGIYADKSLGLWKIAEL
ncbi:MAG: class I SAM-dependent methyltransferase [Proteobacteria bacterium]|nr:class I SAM-dependent methyltransferase [Pseudomonadota bacterium]